MAKSDVDGILPVTFRWVKVWGIGGLLVGIFLMLGKAAPFADSGSHSASFRVYAAWIPVATIIGAVAGLAIGLVYACLLALMDTRRGPSEMQPSSLRRYIPRFLCGAASGLIVTFAPFGSRGALVFAVLAAGCALATAALDVRVKRDG